MRYQWNGRTKTYVVNIGHRGEIKVNNGDILTGYSMAIHKVPFQVTEYGRMSGNRLIPIVNTDLIYAGETIYHIPSYCKAGAGGSAAPQTHAPTKQQKEAALQQLLESDLGFPTPVARQWVQFLIGPKALGTARTGVLLADLYFATNTTALLATGSSILGPLAMIVGQQLAMMSAMESGLRVAATLAMSYGVTAWAFSEPTPGFSRKLRSNRRSAVGDYRDDEFQSAWQQYVKVGVTNVRKLAGGEETAYRLALCVEGEGSPRKLGELLAKDFGKSLAGELKSDYLSLVESGIYYNA